MHVISLIVRICLPLVSSQSDQYQKSYGCFSYSGVVGSGSFTGKMVDLAGYLLNHWANSDVLWKDGSYHIDRHYITGVLGNMEYFTVKCALKCWYTVFYVFSQSGLVLPATQRILGMVTQNLVHERALIPVGLSDPQNSMSQLALVAELLLLEHRHFTGKSVKNRFAQQGVRILSMVIKLGVRKSSTLWLSHTPIRLWIVDRVAELLLLEDHYFTGKWGYR